MSNPPKIRLIAEGDPLSDTVQRRRVDAVLAAEREVFEKLMTNAPLPEVLESITRLAESVCPGCIGSISVLAEDGAGYAYVVAPRLSERLKPALRTAWSASIKAG